MYIIKSTAVASRFLYDRARAYCVAFIDMYTSDPENYVRFLTHGLQGIPGT